MVKTRSSRSQACLYLVRQLALQTPVETSQEASLNSPTNRKGLDGPAMRPQFRLPWRIASGSQQPYWAPNAGTGKRAWRTPTTHFSPHRAKAWWGLLFFRSAENSCGARRWCQSSFGVLKGIRYADSWPDL